MKSLGLLVVIALLIGGYWYYTHHQAEVDGAVSSAVAAKNAAVDGAVTASLQGVSKVSLAYYAENGRSYGTSASKNICTDSTSNDSLGSIIGGIEKYTKAVSCTADPDYPSRSFTLIAPSAVYPGEYYCTDQLGYAGLIASVDTGSAFRQGIKCK